MVDNAGTATDNPFAKDDEQFKKISTQRYMYNAEKCEGNPLVGFMLNLLDMPPIERAGEMRPWQAFLIRTTRPTRAVNREKEVVNVGVGEEVLIPATWELAEFFTKAALNEKAVYEVRIRPDKKLDIGGGQKMWLWDIAAKPEPRARGGFGLAAVLAPPQLPPAGGGAQVTDSPF